MACIVTCVFLSYTMINPQSRGGGETKQKKLLGLILARMCGSTLWLHSDFVTIMMGESNETQDCSNKTVDLASVQKINVSDIYN